MKNSKWIWIDEGAKNNEYVEFLTTFDYKNGRAVLKISVDTEYTLFVNGKYITSGQYADFPWYKVYDEINITSHLAEGGNEIRLLVWFMGDNNYCHYVNRAGLRYELTVDNELVDFSSEKTLCRHAPCFVSGASVKKFNRQLGYSFIRSESAPEEYVSSVAVDGLPDEFVKRPIANLENLPFAEAEKQGNVYDLGAETVGYPYLEIRAPKGERVTVAFSEWVKEDGALPQIMFDGKYDFSFEIIGSGEWQTVFNPLRKLGCRYLSVTDNCEIRKIGLYPVRYPFVHRNYEIDGDLRRKIYDTSVKTLELCAFEHYWDCPWREQAFWTFDSRFQMRYGFAAFADRIYQRAALELLSNDRRDDGLLTMVVPTSGATTIPSFSMSYIYAMSEYIEETGDTTLACQYYSKVSSVMHAYLDRIEEGLVPNFENLWNFYEWKTDYSRVSDRFDSILNLMTAYALDKMIYICRMLEKSEDENYYSEIKSRLSAAVRDRFFDAESGLFRSFEGREAYSELANSLAVLSGVASCAEAERICDIMANKSVEMTETTLSMTALKYDALLLCNKEKYAEYIISDIDSTFEKMLDAGATSFWETVLGKDDFEGSGSLCHGWSALPVYYYKKLGVIREK